jgi:hypothetical protein
MASMIRSALALGAVTLALAAPAGAKTVDSWEVSSSGKTCTMVSTFADDVTVGLILSPKTGELGFIATLPHPNGVRGAPTAQLQLAFDGDSPYTQWEDERATVVAGLDNDAVISTWGAAHSEELAKAVSAASHVKVRVGDKDIGTYDLAGSPAAYRALTRCGGLIAVK